MFATMMDGIKEETVGFLYNLEVQVEETPAPEAVAEPAARGGLPMPDDATIEIKAKGLGRSSRPQGGLQYSAPTIDGAAGGGGVAIQQTQPQPPMQHAPALGVGGPAPSGDGDRPRPTPGRRPSPGKAAAPSNGPSRNAPCPCGSGKKYKRCHGSPTGS
jgi:preprotein translocase subunit SecA